MTLLIKKNSGGGIIGTSAITNIGSNINKITSGNTGGTVSGSGNSHNTNSKAVLVVVVMLIIMV